MSIIAELVAAQARDRPGAPALLAPGRHPASYADLAAQLRRCAKAFREAGLGAWTRVALVPPDGHEAAATYLSVAAQGHCVTLPVRSTAGDVLPWISGSRIAALVAPPDIARGLQATARAAGLALFEIDANPDRPAGCFELLRLAEARRAPTRDTHDHARRPRPSPAAGCRAMVARLGLTGDDRCMNLMAPADRAILTDELLATVATGGSTVCVSETGDEAFFDWVADFQPTWYTATPAAHRAVLRRARCYRQHAPAHLFRFAYSARDGLSPTEVRELERLIDAPVVGPCDGRSGGTDAHGPATYNSPSEPGRIDVALQSRVQTPARAYR